MPWVIPRSPGLPEPTLTASLLTTLTVVPRLAEGEATHSAGLTSWKLGGRQVWGRTGGRWGCNAGIGGTRDRSRILLCSVNSTDAKGQDRNPVVTDLVRAVFGAASPRR